MYVEVLLPQAQDTIDAWKGIELRCSYANKIKTQKATKLHKKHTNEVQKENLDHNRIMRWFIPGNLYWKEEGVWLLWNTR